MIISSHSNSSFVSHDRRFIDQVILRFMWSLFIGKISNQSKNDDLESLDGEYIGTIKMIKELKSKLGE